ncbi:MULTISPECIES: type I glutamate--ammonia ligase [Metallosphaera]|uniref:Glutamine synthetase n=3 Tax=Metallosphaera TaxID=41980 RepID=A4YH65_METS5|nr:MULTISPECIES: type I glutamate--ammonia ligase [Metallosphaera]ABP95767.1 L-glutamine synthetase [Metallosphaera sedula DSM 5348]AIM27751.1 L-glutamine synthetase [Metallosphaera sedula]AKV74608.1 glutamine synthetase [Metallosphaera sedula]AKV76846.1 glutamine synthetase [Metallosphaera sedula]AKV79097.1 glutamine synthetase [Metallosphaera sedula]
MPKTPEEAVEYVKQNKVEWIDLQFTDLPGRLQHVTIPASDFTVEEIKNGFGKLDGSSIKGFTTIYESDMVLSPVLESLVALPWSPSVARVLTKVYWGGGKGRFERDPRYVAETAESVLSGEGYISYYGPELEFFLFDRVDVDVKTPQQGTGYKITAREAPWNGGGGYIIRYKEGYYPAPPVDQLMDVRLDIIQTLTKYFGFTIEAAHHEVATAGQGEIDFRFSTMVDAADKLQTLKYVIRNVAAKYGLVATFMPKPMFGDNGTGMHTHFSLWTKNGKNLMYDPNDEYAELSQFGRYVIGGILSHARSLSAIVSPTVNSYRRLIPGFEAPVYVAWSKGNRSAVIRVPSYYKGMEKAKRIEYRAPDPSTNPYLAFAAIAAAALDGVKKKIDPGNPVDTNIYHLTPEKRKELGIKELPRSLDEALDELESDTEFLKPIFNSSILETFIDLKREESRTLQMYPHPMEIYYYLDV